MTISENRRAISAQPHAYPLLKGVVAAVLLLLGYRAIRQHFNSPLLTDSAGGHAAGVTPEAVEPHGALIHWSRGYDWLTRVAFLGRESRVRSELLGAVALSPGDRVLDVACGTGTLAVAAARRVGQDGWVGAVDAAPEMVKATRRKAARTAVDIDVREGLAQALPFPDASVDAVVTSLAWHHIPATAQTAALTEMTRVLRPGGRLLIADFQSPPHPLARRLGTRVLGHPMAGDEVDAIVDLVTTAGLVEVDRGTTSARWLAFVTARKPANGAVATSAG